MTKFARKYATFGQSPYFVKSEKRVQRQYPNITRSTLCTPDEKRFILSDYDNEDSGIRSLASRSRSISHSKCAMRKVSKTDTSERSDWRSIFVATFLCFCGFVQSSLYFASMWPFLQTIDNTATESFYGYIVAAHSIGEIIGSPLIGYLGNRLKNIRYLLYGSICLMFTGNVIYFNLELIQPLSRKYVMLLSRILMGLGASSTSLLQAYVATASIPEDRSRVISVFVGGMAMGNTIGPTFQLLFTPLGYPGWNLFGWKVNMYTAPALLACTINVVGSLSIYLFFRENYVGVIQEKNHSSVTTVLKAPVPKYDLIAVLLCHTTRFTKLFVFCYIEAVGASFLGLMFAWTDTKVVQFMASIETVSSILHVLIYFGYIVFRLEKIIDFRLNCVACLLSFSAFFLLTYSYQFLSGEVVTYNASDAYNATNQLGCNTDKFSWCESVKPMSPTMYFAGHVILIAVSFASMSVALNTLFSKILGPRKQGTQQGFFQMSGGIGRMIGPVLISSLYTSYGPTMAWNLELGVVFLTILLWIAFYKRMVPLQIQPQIPPPFLKHEKTIFHNESGYFSESLQKTASETESEEFDEQENPENSSQNIPSRTKICIEYFD